MLRPRPLRPAPRLHHRFRPCWLGAAAACCLAGLTLRPAARAETVALGSFAHANFERNDADTSAAFAAAVQAGLESHGQWKFVERTETNRIFDELGLSRRGFVSADTAARVGKLLKADLLLSGTVFTPKGAKAYLILETDQLARAEPIAQARVELGRVLDKGHLTLPSSEDLARIVAAAARLLDTSTAQIAAQRGRTILKLLFLTNKTNDPSLNGLERLVAAQLERAAAASSTHRMLQLDRPEIATPESELALLGLVEADPNAWAQVADYYLWGSCQTASGTVTLTLNLWDGQRPPQVLTESAAPSELPALAVRMTQRIIAAAGPSGGAPHAGAGGDQRTKVAALLEGQAKAVGLSVAKPDLSPAVEQAALAEQRRLLVAAIFFAPAAKDSWIRLSWVRAATGNRTNDLPALLCSLGDLEYGLEVADRFLVAPDGGIDAQASLGLNDERIVRLMHDFRFFQDDLKDVYVGRNLLALKERAATSYRIHVMRSGRRLATAGPGQSDDYRQAAEVILTAALQQPFTQDERKALIDALWPRLKVAIFVHRAWYPAGTRLRQLDRLLREFYVDQHQLDKADALDVLSPSELAAALAAPPPNHSPAQEKLESIEFQEQQIARIRKSAPKGGLQAAEQNYLAGQSRQIAEMRAAVAGFRLRAEVFLRSHTEAGSLDAAFKARLLQGPVSLDVSQFTPPLETYPPAAKARQIPVLRELATRRAAEGYPAPVVARLRARADALERELAANPQAGTTPLPPYWSQFSPQYLDPGPAGAGVILSDLAAKGDLPSLQALFERGTPVEAAGDAFIAAIRGEQWPVVDYLLERGYDPAAPWPKIETRAASASWDDHPGRIALAEAAIRGRQSLVDQLLKKGVRFDARNGSGRYAVLELTKSRRLRLLQQMLAAGANPNGALSGETTPLGYAIRAHDLALLKALLGAGADPADFTGHSVTTSSRIASSSEWEKFDESRLPETALTLCARENWLEGARALVERVSPDVRQRLREYQPHRLATAPAVRAVFLRAELQAVSTSPEADRAGIDLFTAIAAGDQSGFAAALARPGSLDFRGQWGATALMFACEEKAEGMARQLMDAGAALDAFNEIGATPLCYAAMNGEIGLAEAMVRKGADINLSRGRADRPLDLAIVAARDPALALRLLELGAAFGSRPEEPGMTPLFQATKKDLPEVVRELLRRGADPRQVIAGYSIFFPAALSNDPDLIQLFADLKCDLNRRNPDGWTPLVSAVRWGAAASVQKLLELGLRDPKAAALAISMTQDRQVRERPDPAELRQLHYRPDYRRCLEIMDEFGQITGSRLAQDSVFWHTTHSIAEIEAYLRAGGSVNFHGTHTPLDGAIGARDVAKVAFLLAKGADPNLVGTARDASPPLRSALEYPDIVELLLKHGANPNTVIDHEDGGTVLGWACFDGNVPIETIRLLVRYGANPNIDARAMLAQATRSSDPQRAKNVSAALDGQ